jgi:hypothetical protein
LIDQITTLFYHVSGLPPGTVPYRSRHGTSK